jgi:hypothetical protein
MNGTNINLILLKIENELFEGLFISLIKHYFFSHNSILDQVEQIHLIQSWVN